MLQRHTCRCLLGILLAAPDPAANLLAADLGGDREGAVVWWTVLHHHVLADQRAATGETFLQRGLEIDGVFKRVVK
jgi:hypothetical protein